MEFPSLLNNISKNRKLDALENGLFTIYFDVNKIYLVGFPSFLGNISKNQKLDAGHFENGLFIVLYHLIRQKQIIIVLVEFASFLGNTESKKCEKNANNDAGGSENGPFKFNLIQIKCMLYEFSGICIIFGQYREQQVREECK